jgi:putative transposase
MFQLVDAEKAHYPVTVLCEVLEVSRSGYYDWKKRPCCERSKVDAQLAVQIAATHTKSGKRYGSP